MTNTTKYAVSLAVLFFISILLGPTLTGRISAYNAEPIYFSGRIHSCSEELYVTGRSQTVKSINMTIENNVYEYHIPGRSRYDSILYKGLRKIRDFCKSNEYLNGSYIIEPTKIIDITNRIVYLSKFNTELNKEMMDYSKKFMDYVGSIITSIIIVLSYIFLFIAIFKSTKLFQPSIRYVTTNKNSKKLSKRRRKINKRIELKKKISK